MIIDKREGVILRHATAADLPRVDEIAIICYAPIVASFIEIVGEECVQGIYGDLDFDWKTRKTKQVRAGARSGTGTFFSISENREFDLCSSKPIWMSRMFRHATPTKRSASIASSGS